MKVVTYTIELLEPALVASAQGDPNSAVAFDYVPGSVLRGILIGKYLGSKSADANDDTLRRLFFNGSTRYLNGYPLDAYGFPSLPVPASWQRIKDDEGTIFDFALNEQRDEQQWQSVPQPFYTQSGKSVRLIQPERNVAVHTQRTARFGRAMPEYRFLDNDQTSEKAVKWLKDDDIPGAVYRYDALAAGQTFQAAIICDNDADAQTLRNLLGGTVTLGGSRSGGYGQARINMINGDVGWDAVEDEEDGPVDRLIVTLRSDVLVRDERGQYAVDPELLCCMLSDHLKVGLKLEDAFLNTQVVAGFNRKWRLPLPQALATRMGSVLIFQDPGCDPALLRDLEIRGIGERRAEGFGCIVFNQQRAEKLEVKENKRQNRSLDHFTIRGTEAGDLAGLMVSRMLRKQLDAGLLATANSLNITNPPSNAQLSRLRSVLLEEIRAAAPDIRKIHQFIKGIQERGSARRQFERSILNDKESLLRWLQRLLKCDSDNVWKMADNDWRAELGLKEIKVAIQIGDVNAKIDDGMRLKYILRLIDLVLAKAAKERGKEN